MPETEEQEQKRIQLEMDAAFFGRNIKTMTEREILEMELSFALDGKENLSVYELMKVPEFCALSEYNYRHDIEEETPEERKANDEWVAQLEKDLFIAKIEVSQKDI